MTDNSNIIHTMRKKLGHYRQYSAPELNSMEYPDNSEEQLLRNTTESEMFKQQQTLMHMSSLNLTPIPGITTEQLETLHLKHEEESESRSHKLFDHSAAFKGTKRQFNNTTQNVFPNEQESPRSIESHNGDTGLRRSSLPEETQKLKENQKSLDTLTREELIEKLKFVENELAKTKKSPSDSPDMKDDSNSQEQFDCLWKGCDKTFVVLEVLIAHIGQEHIGSGKASYTCEWRECPRNQKPFTKRHKMYNHMRTHTGERPFQCPIPDCGKKFSRPDSLSTHVKTHSNVRPYICPVPGCGKAYYHSRSLRKHIKSHEISRSAHLYSPSYANGNEMPYYNSQPFFRQDDFNIPHDMKYPSEPSFFDTLKPEEMNSMQSHPPHESIGREGLLPPAIGGIDIGSGPFGVNNLQMQQMQASSNMLEPPVIQSHSFSEGDTTGYPSSGISSSLGSDMMTTTIPTQNYYTVASGSTPPFPSQPVFIHSTAPPSMPPTSQQL